MLRTEKISVSYGQVEVLKFVSIEVADGEVVSVIGPNGAGKTTLLRAISGLIPVNKGEIVFDGRRIDNEVTWEIVQRGIAHIPEGRQIFGGLTVEENLILGAYWRIKKGRRQRVKEDMGSVFQIFPVLGKKRKESGETLSGGEQAMLAIGRALMLAPKILLMDEPSMGLAPILVEEIYGKLLEVNRKGTSILLVEQNYDLALSLANKVFVLETGQVRFSGSVEAVVNNANINITDIYLGKRKMRGED